jgi:hypothetical protein
VCSSEDPNLAGELISLTESEVRPAQAKASPRKGEPPGRRRRKA